jgi:DNA-directed RNA polymerase specialized sigma24 family protein
METDVTAFELYHERLVAHLGRYVATAPEVIEDACGFAWLQWARLRPAGPDVYRWLVVVASREALHLLHRAKTDAERTVELRAAQRLDDPRCDPVPATALHDAFLRLSPRQQRFLTMQALGLSYMEMSDASGDSVRTVDRQLVRARAAFRSVLAA